MTATSSSSSFSTFRPSLSVLTRVLLFSSRTSVPLMSARKRSTFAPSGFSSMLRIAGLVVMPGRATTATPSPSMTATSSSSSFLTCWPSLSVLTRVLLRSSRTSVPSLSTRTRSTFSPSGFSSTLRIAGFVVLPGRSTTATPWASITATSRSYSSLTFWPSLFVLTRVLLRWSRISKPLPLSRVSPLGIDDALDASSRLRLIGFSRSSMPSLRVITRTSPSSSEISVRSSKVLKRTLLDLSFILNPSVASMVATSVPSARRVLKLPSLSISVRGFPCSSLRSNRTVRPLVSRRRSVPIPPSMRMRSMLLSSLTTRPPLTTRSPGTSTVVTPSLPVDDVMNSHEQLVLSLWPATSGATRAATDSSRASMLRTTDKLIVDSVRWGGMAS